MGGRKEEYRELKGKTIDFGGGQPGQVPSSEKMCRELKHGADPPCEEPRKNIIGKGNSRYTCPKVGDPGWFERGEMSGSGGEVG